MNILSANEDNFYGAPIEQNTQNIEQHNILNNQNQNQNQEVHNVEQNLSADPILLTYNINKVDDKTVEQEKPTTSENFINIKICFWIFILCLIMLIIFFGYKKYNKNL
jgi:ATP-dependent Zn protease